MLIKSLLENGPLEAIERHSCFIVFSTEESFLSGWIAVAWCSGRPEALDIAGELIPPETWAGITRNPPSLGFEPQLILHLRADP